MTLQLSLERMTIVGFENPLFLAALGAVAVPVIIHLIFRLRKRVVPFGTLRFLQKVVQRNRRRLRLRDIILLVLRATAVALLALALARPFFTGPAASSSEVKPNWPSCGFTSCPSISANRCC